MALFKIYKGNENELQKISYHEGYAYFCEDTRNFWIDSSGSRLQVNAYAASVLKNGATEIDIDDIMLKNMVASIAQGGTGASTAEEARTNLDVYSKEEVDNNATSVSYKTTLFQDAWTQEESTGKYIYKYANTNLRCGKDGDIPPIITYTSNKTDYSNISSDDTLATPGDGILFKTSTLPSADIGLIIIDVK